MSEEFDNVRENVLEVLNFEKEVQSSYSREILIESLENYKYEACNLLKKLREISEAAMKAGWRAESGESIPEYIVRLGEKVQEYEKGN